MLDRTQAPAYTRSTAFALLQPQEIILSNGATLFVVSGGEQDVIKTELVFSAGRWFETHWGAAYFSSQLLSKGTRNKSSFTIAELFDRYGAHLEISPGLDTVSISLYTLVKNLVPTFQLVLELLQESVFPEKEIELMKSVYLQNLKVNNEKTSFQASKLIRKKLFGETHPYGKELEPSDVEALSREQIVQHHSVLHRAMTVIVSGKVDSASLDFISAQLSALKLSNPDLKKATAKQSDPMREIVKKEGSVQASLRLAKKSISRLDNHYAGLVFLNHILGGYFGSRLMKNIREEKGLTYGINSSLHTLKNESYLAIGADVNNENIEIVFTEIRHELKRLQTEKVGKDELEIARNHFIGSLQSEITTPFAHAEKIKNMFFFNLPTDFYQQMIRTVDHIDADALLALANQYMAHDSFHEVAVG